MNSNNTNNSDGFTFPETKEQDTDAVILRYIIEFENTKLKENNILKQINNLEEDKSFLSNPKELKALKKRLKDIPVIISLISRLQEKKEQKEIVKDINEGKIDIIIGTHRLLSRDIEFKNLGLFIIDDEQRFGVKQKEKLKNLS